MKKLMKLMAVVTVLAFGLLGAAEMALGADLDDGYTKEVSGPRKGEYRTFGWQERERGSDSTLQFGGGGDGATGDAGAAGAASGDAGAGATGGNGPGDGCSPK
jgi:hypothetical protein